MAYYENKSKRHHISDTRKIGFNSKVRESDTHY